MDNEQYKLLKKVNLKRYVDYLYKDRITMYDLGIVRIADLCEKVKNSYLGNDSGLLTEKDYDVVNNQINNKLDNCSIKPYIDLQYIFKHLSDNELYKDKYNSYSRYCAESLYNLLLFTCNAEKENSSRVASKQAEQIAELNAENNIITVFDKYRIENLDTQVIENFYTSINRGFCRMYVYDNILQLLADYIKMPEIKVVFYNSGIKENENCIKDINSLIKELKTIIARDGFEREKGITTKAGLRRYIQNNFKTIDIKALQPSKAYCNELLKTFKKRYLYNLDNLVVEMENEVIQNERSKKHET